MAREQYGATVASYRQAVIDAVPSLDAAPTDTPADTSQTTADASATGQTLPAEERDGSSNAEDTLGDAGPVRSERE